MSDKPELVKKRTDMSTIPTKQYIDQTVAPILLNALKSLARERPADPIQFVADYLVKNKSANGEQQRDSDANGSEPN